MIVIDASITMAWNFDDERTTAIDAVLDQVVELGAIVPQIWPVEIANSLRTAKRRGRISLDRRNAILGDLRALDVTIDPETLDRVWTEVITISDRHDLTVYDATYVELAIRQGAVLATLDEAMARAAHAEGLTVLP